MESVGSLDIDRVRATVAQLSAALETNDHLAELDRILKAHGRTGAGPWTKGE